MGWFQQRWRQSGVDGNKGTASTCLASKNELRLGEELRVSGYSTEDAGMDVYMYCYESIAHETFRGGDDLLDKKGGEEVFVSCLERWQFGKGEEPCRESGREGGEECSLYEPDNKKV